LQEDAVGITTSGEWTVDDRMREIIQARLREIEASEKIAVLFACESGSRGWQFASADSDYDVRFIYLHPLEWYLTFLTVIINVIVSLMVAVALKRSFYGRDWLRVLFYGPGIMSVSVIGILAGRVWDQQRGIVNYFLINWLDLPRIN
jgi:ABC-type sugar transport system permease subunit